ncbi:Heat shock protein 15 like protein [Saliniradius amylolyticus]|uniref:Heat shock protein 15 n=1 Tax=Saliniradius amylolyticus TaxID=2183582 RepID=A0A2S2DZ03_9ALTE|nr:ribosome-associated heat shock protein Hsp15 [Saliniradius amylolyticus]AWL10631.1 Heat shock protein 15 like protein [Saliniradius amylolyticus]
MNKSTTEPQKVRLDKWLWAARLYKTRSLARDMIQGGKVHYNGQRVKPGKLVELGALIRLAQGFDHKEILVQELHEKRRSAKEIVNMYEETQASIEQREKNAAARKLGAMYNPNPEQKPDKKQRRNLIKFKQQK